MTNNNEQGERMSEIDDLLNTVADYAEAVDQAGRMEQSKSMAAAAALDALYERREWVDEWLEQSPAPTTPRALNNFKPDSRNRFTKWLEWKQTERKRAAPKSQYVYRLLDAEQIAQSLNFANGERQTRLTEGMLRPLKWMRKYRYDDRLPEVWKRAVAIAGSDSKVTETTVKQALADWKRETLGGRGMGNNATPNKQEQRSRQVAKWRAQHDKIVREFRAFAHDAPNDPDAFQEYKELIREIQEIAIEVRDQAKLRAV